MIDIKHIRDLVKLMKSNDLTELDLQSEGERITLKRAGADQPAQGPVQLVSPAAPPPPAQQQPAAAGESDSSPSAEPSAEEQGLIEIKSPMVGTFYAAPTPDAEAFVKVGDSVGADTVICIIEAMKVFNEIKAEAAGVIQKVLVNNGQAVEFGETLFLVKPQ